MVTSEPRLATGVLVIGTGGSGLRAAIELAELGMAVLAVGKRPKADAHTALAAGGINAALATMDREDTWQQHAADTLKESYPSPATRPASSPAGGSPSPSLTSKFHSADWPMQAPSSGGPHGLTSPQR